MSSTEDTVHSRLKLLIEKLGLNQNSFAVKTGISPTAIGNIIGGRLNTPSHEVVQKIKSAFPKINLNWLYSGEQYPMFEDMDISTGAVYEPMTTYGGDLHKIPVVSLHAAANAMRGMEASEPIEIAYNIELPSVLVGPGTFIALPVRGNSMSPTIIDGSIAVFRKLDRAEWHNFKQGWIHLVYTEAYGSQVKYLKRSSRNNLFWIMESENTAEHPTVSVDIREVMQLWEWKLTIATKFVSLKNTIYERIDSLEAITYELDLKVNNLEKTIKHGSQEGTR